MRGFEYNGDFPNNAQLEKRATLSKLNGDPLGQSIRVDTACRDDGKTTLLVAEKELDDLHIEHLAIAGGRIVLKFDGAFYTFHTSDPLTNRLIFWPLAVAVADVHEGQEHIEKFENEGGPVHPAEVECPACSRAGGADRPVHHLPPICEDTRIGTVVQPRYPVSGPSVTAIKETRAPECTGPFSDARDCPVHDPRKRVNPNEDGGVNWPIGGDRPADAARVVGTSAGARDAKC